MNGKKRFVSLKTKILTSTLIPLAVSLIITYLIGLPVVFNSLRNTARAELMLTGQKYANDFEGKLSSAMDYLSILSGELETHIIAGAPDRATMQKIIYNAFDNFKQINGSNIYFEPDMYDGQDADFINSDYGTKISGRICWYYYMQGEKAMYLPEALGDDRDFEMPLYLDVKNANKVIYTNPHTYVIKGTGVLMFSIAHPIQNDGEFIGAVSADLFLDDIYQELQNEKIYESGYILITNSKGRLIYSPNYGDIGKTLEETGAGYALPSKDEPSPVFRVTKIDGKNMLVSVHSVYIPKRDDAFYVSVTVPYDEIYAEGTGLMILLIIFLLAAVIILSGLQYFLIGKISAPLNEITEKAGKIAGGEFGARIAGAYKGEFAIVKNALNTMAESVEASINDIKTTAVELDKQLKQQTLITSVSQSFLSDADPDALIDNTLRMVGEFMGLAQLIFYTLDDDEVTLICQHEWVAPKFNIESRAGMRLTLKEPLLSIIKGLTAGGNLRIDFSDPVLKAAIKPYRTYFHNYIVAPVFVHGKMGAVLDFSREDGGIEWSESDINLAILISSVLSGVLERGAMESQTSIVENSPQFVAYIMTNGGVSYVNPAVAKMTGCTKAEIMTLGLELIFNAQTARVIREIYIPRILREGTHNFEVSLVDRDGNNRILAFTGFKTGENTIGAIASDITEMRELEAELVRAKNLAESKLYEKNKNSQPPDKTGPAKNSRSFDFKGKTALLVEDVEINREIVIAALEDTRIKIECAENGREAVELFSAFPKKYDIILMDVNMPEMDGLTATRLIRKMPGEGSRVPIVALTANVLPEDVKDCLAAGMNDHIGKPLDFNELLDKIKKYIK